MMDAGFPRIVKYVMSLCHIWFGVARSNRRGGGLIVRWRFFGAVVRPFAFNCWRTVSGLAFSQKNRRSTCEMRRTPWPGSSRLSARIFSRTTAWSLGAPPCGTRSSRPARPSWR